MRVFGLLIFSGDSIFGLGDRSERGLREDDVDVEDRCDRAGGEFV